MNSDGEATQSGPVPSAATPIFDLLLAEVGVRWPGATAWINAESEPPVPDHPAHRHAAYGGSDGREDQRTADYVHGRFG